MSTEKEQISWRDVDNWVGNQGYADKRDDWMLDALLKIAQGKYTPEQLKSDILGMKD